MFSAHEVNACYSPLPEALCLHCREVASKVALAVAQDAIQSGAALGEERQGSTLELKNMERHLQDLQYDPFKGARLVRRLISVHAAL
jgi:hypothetical protein